MAMVTGVSPIDATIAAVQPIVPNTASVQAEHGPAFADLLRQQLDQAVSLSNDAEAAQQQFAAGQITDVNQVVMAMSKADLALTFALELRNKVLEAYQEVNRTQI
jgi:flagellar hook-basal body complex protein FliE